MTYLTVALDAMSGDFGPQVIVPAALQALAIEPQLNLLLVGQPEILTPLLATANPSLLARLEIIPAAHIIANDAKPAQVIRNSHNSSMRIALEIVKEGRAAACVSAGNTGVLMGLAKLLLKPLPGIDRPALVSVLPNQRQGRTLVLDLGANVLCNSQMLVQFAVMGAVMAEEVLGIRQPRVALLNIGEEEHKGPESIRDAAALLKGSQMLDYVGYLEGNDLLLGKADVIVCDGFVGNVTLKTLEGLVRLFLSLLASPENDGKPVWWWRFLKSWLQKKMAKQFGYLDPDQYNGACLLGLRGIVIKSHGGASQHAFTAAIQQAASAIRGQVPARIASRLGTVLLKSD